MEVRSNQFAGGSERGVRHLSSASFNSQQFLACLCLSLPLIAKPSTHNNMSLWDIDCSLNQRQRKPTKIEQWFVRIPFPVRELNFKVWVGLQLRSPLSWHLRSRNWIILYYGNEIPNLWWKVISQMTDTPKWIILSPRTGASVTDSNLDAVSLAVRCVDVMGATFPVQHFY